MESIAEIIDQALLHHDEPVKIQELKQRVHAICEQFPLWYDG